MKFLNVQSSVHWLGLLGFLLFVGLASCLTPPHLGGLPCSQDTDCEVELKCLKGFCGGPNYCRKDFDCRQTTVCRNSQCVAASGENSQEAKTEKLTEKPKETSTQKEVTSESSKESPAPEKSASEPSNKEWNDASAPEEKPGEKPPGEKPPGEKSPGEKPPQEVVKEQSSGCANKTSCVSTFTGKCETQGYKEGTATVAEFSSPSGIAIDAAGNVYIADTRNHCIRKVDPQGNTSIYAGQCTSPGKNGGDRLTSARFRLPQGMTFDSSGHLYVADTGNNCIRKIDGRTGRVLPFAGLCGGKGNSVPKSINSSVAALQARFDAPSNIIFDATPKNFYIADSKNYCIRKIDKNGNLSTFAGTCTLKGTVSGYKLSKTSFLNPQGLAKVGKILYVADLPTGNNTGRLVEVSGKTGIDVAIRSGFFSGAYGVISHGSKGLLVSDHIANSIKRLVNGNISLVAGKSGSAGFKNAEALQSKFKLPQLMALYQNNLYILDTGNHCIRKLSLP